MWRGVIFNKNTLNFQIPTSYFYKNNAKRVVLLRIHCVFKFLLQYFIIALIKIRWILKALTSIFYKSNVRGFFNRNLLKRGSYKQLIPLSTWLYRNATYSSLLHKYKIIKFIATLWLPIALYYDKYIYLPSNKSFYNCSFSNPVNVSVAKWVQCRTHNL